MKSPPRARSPTLLRILLYSGFGAKCGAPHFAPLLLKRHSPLLNLKKVPRIHQISEDRVNLTVALIYIKYKGYGNLDSPRTGQPHLPVVHPDRLRRAVPGRGCPCGRAIFLVNYSCMFFYSLTRIYSSSFLFF
jgi:hypothetical protein